MDGPQKRWTKIASSRVHDDTLSSSLCFLYNPILLLLLLLWAFSCCRSMVDVVVVVSRRRNEDEGEANWRWQWCSSSAGRHDSVEDEECRNYVEDGDRIEYAYWIVMRTGTSYDSRYLLLFIMLCDCYFHYFSLSFLMHHRIAEWVWGRKLVVLWWNLERAPRSNWENGGWPAAECRR